MEPQYDPIPFRGRGVRVRPPRRAALIGSRRLTVAAWSWLWRACTWLASRGRANASESQVQRHVFRDQAARMGLRMTELLRDRYRPRWLRRVTPVDGPDVAETDRSSH